MSIGGSCPGTSNAVCPCLVHLVAGIFDAKKPVGAKFRFVGRRMMMASIKMLQNANRRPSNALEMPKMNSRILKYSSLMEGEAVRAINCGKIK